MVRVLTMMKTLEFTLPLVLLSASVLNKEDNHKSYRNGNC